MTKEIFITKAGGAREPFAREKLLKSLIRAKASEAVAGQIVKFIEDDLEDGTPTTAIYEHAFSLLGKLEKRVAPRYSLKKALFELGPSGFPFEKFIAELFRLKGYSVETDKIVPGHCAEHEIDVVAWNEKDLTMVEAKFHNEIGMKSDLKTALYIKARFDDLKDIEFDYGRKRKVDHCLLITNTKFTDKAIKYAECAGVKMIGWNYPAGHTLQNFIEDSGLHPITSLTTLSLAEKKKLIENGVILCKDARRDPNILRVAGLDQPKIEKVIEESNHLCPLD